MRIKPSLHGASWALWLALGPVVASATPERQTSSEALPRSPLILSQQTSARIATAVGAAALTPQLTLDLNVSGMTEAELGAMDQQTLAAAIAEAPARALNIAHDRAASLLGLCADPGTTVSSAHLLIVSHNRTRRHETAKLSETS